MFLVSLLVAHPLTKMLFLSPAPPSSTGHSESRIREPDNSPTLLKIDELQQSEQTKVSQQAQKGQCIDSVILHEEKRSSLTRKRTFLRLQALNATAPDSRGDDCRRLRCHTFMLGSARQLMATL